MKKIQTVPTWEDIQESHQAIQPMIHRTPVLTNTAINELTGAQLYFKCENFQKVGAFKMRGASNAAMRLTEADKKRIRDFMATHKNTIEKLAR